MSHLDVEQYTAILKSTRDEKQYSLFVSREDRLADIAKFLKDLQTIPNIRSEDQFAFKGSPKDSYIPHHSTVGQIAGDSPCSFELFVEIVGDKNGEKGKACCQTF